MGFPRQSRFGWCLCLPGQVPVGDPGRAGPSGVGDLAVPDQAAEMVGGVAALASGLRQRERDLVLLDERGLEFGRAAIERDGWSLAPVAAERLGLPPPGRRASVSTEVRVTPLARSPCSLPVTLGIPA